jgi:hypothetical protein
MIFQLLGLIAIVILTIFVYRTAKDTGRNAVGWAMLVVVVGFGLQIVAPIVIATILVIYLAATTAAYETEIQNWNGVLSVVGIFCLVLSFVGMWLVLKTVSKIPDEASDRAAPPPPPMF